MKTLSLKSTIPGRNNIPTIKALRTASALWRDDPLPLKEAKVAVDHVNATGRPYDLYTGDEHIVTAACGALNALGVGARIVEPRITVKMTVSDLERLRDTAWHVGGRQADANLVALGDRVQVAMTGAGVGA